MDQLLAPYLADPRIASLGNLMMSLIVLTWTWGMKPADGHRPVWLGWLGFWIGTSLFYVCHTLSPSWEGIPFTGLYAATWSLLAAYLHERRRRPLMIALVVVAVVVIADVTTSQLGSTPVLHQLLTACVLMAWAWRIRHKPGESTALIVYAIVQLPLQPLFALVQRLAGTPSQVAAPPDYTNFVAATYIAYLVLKLTLISPIAQAVNPSKA